MPRIKFKAEIIIGLLAVAIAILAWQFPQSNSNTQDSSRSVVTPSYANSNLYISSTGATVKIKESKSGIAYGGGTISGTNASNIIHLPKGQILSIKVTGTGVTLEIESGIIEFINVSNSGTGTEIIEI